MYKYQTIGNEIKELLFNKKLSGVKTITLTSKEIDELFNVSERCGDKFGTRYPLCCQAMDYASKKYKATYISGNNPSSKYTLEYKLTLF